MTVKIGENLVGLYAGFVNFSFNQSFKMCVTLMSDCVVNETYQCCKYSLHRMD